MTIVQHSLGDTSVLHLRGRLCAPVDAALRHQVGSLLQRGQRRLLIDLAGLSNLDAAGVGELVCVHNMAAAANGALRISHALDNIRNLIARVGLLGVLGVDEEHDTRRPSLTR